MSNFVFLQDEFQELAQAAQGAEQFVYDYPLGALMCARQTLESVVWWMYQHDKTLIEPYDATLYNLLDTKEFIKLVPEHVRLKMDLLRRSGNGAAHAKGKAKFVSSDAIKAIQELFLIVTWFERTYGNVAKDRSHPRVFKLDLIPASRLQTNAIDVSKFQKEQQEKEAEIAQKHAELKQWQDDLNKRSLDLAEQEKQLAQVDKELAEARAQVEINKALNAKVVDNTDYREADTRKYLIDLLLKESGWIFGKNVQTEVPVQGMPNEQNEGLVDYVLYGENGKPLAVVEAKRTSASPEFGKQQAKLYADCLEQMTGQRPIIFYTNGHQTYLWNDDKGGPPRLVRGFYTQAELQRLIERRKNTVALSSIEPNPDIVGRHYQIRAIKALQAAFELNRRSGLLIMATGTGKTRTAVALVDVLMKANVVQKVLFLADRTSLVNQATNQGFKAHLPQVAAVNLVTSKDQNGRVYLSTYQTMMNLIDQRNEDGTLKFGVGMFDLIIVDEAHRSVYQKYGEIFKYFDARLVGLTATPRDEVDFNTYQLFGLENGVPTDYYPMDQAIAEGFLTPPKAYSVPLKFMREGVKYTELSEQEKEQWEGLDWGDDTPPEEVGASEINKKLFNQDTVDKMLKHLMEHGLKVEGGDRLGKTIIFAVNQKHAEFIGERFDANYPEFNGKFARVITHSTKYAQDLIDKFSEKDLPDPQIAISVDMLDTGIDVEEIVNLVFFKAVRSKVKFIQMIGRGTRLCEDLFYPGKHKEEFYIFDYCGNFEYFEEKPNGAKSQMVEPIGQRLFKERLNLLSCLNTASVEMTEDTQAFFDAIRNGLMADVKSMKTENFIVRGELEHVERFQKDDTWNQLDDLDIGTLKEHLSHLPMVHDYEPLQSKLFDLLCYKIQLALLQSNDNAFTTYKNTIQETVSPLESKTSIPEVAANIVLIQDLLTDSYWDNVTLDMLENIRKKIRPLVPLIEKTTSTVVYTVLEDEMGEMQPVRVPDVGSGVDVKQYRKKVESFIKANESHLTIAKLKNGMQLTKTDLEELERFVFESEVVEGKERFEACYGEQQSLVKFIRSLVGLDRQAVSEAFSKYLAENHYNVTQIRFIEMIIEQLTQNGMLEVGQLYQPPFTSLHYKSLNGVFGMGDAKDIASIVKRFGELSVA